MFHRQPKRLQPRAILIALALLPLSLAYAEIYQWTDENGRVHFSDQRAARKDAMRRGEKPNQATTDGVNFRFLPQADALITSNSEQPKGKASMLSTGYWKTRTVEYQTRSIVRFEITELLKALNMHKLKHLDTARIEFFANTQDKLYGQGITNKQSPGHSTLRGDNAFYIKAVHNNWSEDDVTWQTFYAPTHYTPLAIRKLPSISAPGSDGVPDKNYWVDATDLIAALVLAQQREFTLELSPQRKSTMAQVTFFSRESDKPPVLTVKLK